MTEPAPPEYEPPEPDEFDDARAEMDQWWDEHEELTAND